jgi:hypothetical protein
MHLAAEPPAEDSQPRPALAAAQRSCCAGAPARTRPPVPQGVTAGPGQLVSRSIKQAAGRGWPPATCPVCPAGAATGRCWRRHARDRWRRLQARDGVRLRVLCVGAWAPGCSAPAQQGRRAQGPASGPTRTHRARVDARASAAQPPSVPNQANGPLLSPGARKGHPPHAPPVSAAPRLLLRTTAPLESHMAAARGLRWPTARALPTMASRRAASARQATAQHAAQIEKIGNFRDLHEACPSLQPGGPGRWLASRAATRARR